MTDDIKSLDTATFAGGCFWCMEGPFRNLEGVTSVISGYIGGHVKNPTYQEVSSGDTGHYEAVQVTYDPGIVGYEKLLNIFWMQIDPTDTGGQFADRGSQYKTAIFFHSEKQKELAEKAKKNLNESGRFMDPVATEILPASEFYPAEEYHQQYHQKNPFHYKLYRHHSGRELYLDDTWSDRV